MREISRLTTTNSDVYVMRCTGLSMPIENSFSICTVGLGCYAGWNFSTYVPYASDGLLDSPDQCDHFDIPLALSNRLVVALEGLEVLAI